MGNHETISPSRLGVSVGTKDGNDPDHPYEMQFALFYAGAPANERWTLTVTNPRPDLVKLLIERGFAVHVSRVAQKPGHV